MKRIYICAMLALCGCLYFSYMANAQAQVKLNYKQTYLPGDSIVVQIAEQAYADSIALMVNERSFPVKRVAVEPLPQGGAAMVYGTLPTGRYWFARIKTQENGIRRYEPLSGESFMVTSQRFDAVQPRVKIMVVSDPHLMAHEMKGDGFRPEMLPSTRKLLAESEELMRAFVDTLKQQRPDILLIPGDLTKDGSLISHKRMLDMLGELLNSGVKVYVVPGNHDINIPNSGRFVSGKYVPTPTIDAPTFASLYARCGYADAWSRDKASLSYAVSPTPDICILALDANLYAQNKFVSRGDAKNESSSAGYLKEETMQWIDTVATAAHRRGQRVIAMMHHGVVPHIPYQDKIAKPYLVENYQAVQQALTRNHIRLVITGHFHATDVASVKGDSTGQLYDMAVGSLITYPCPYRTMALNRKTGYLYYTTDWMRYLAKPLSNGEADVQRYAKNCVTTGLDQLITSYAFSQKNKLIARMMSDDVDVVSMFSPDDYDKLKRAFELQVAPLCSQLILTFYEGNEGMLDTSQFEPNLMRAIESVLRAIFPAEMADSGNQFLSALRKMSLYQKVMKAIADVLNDSDSAENMKLTDWDGLILL